MYIYSVIINIEKSAEQEWLDFMQKKHIADVLHTGCFTNASMRKEINNTTNHIPYTTLSICLNQKITIMLTSKKMHRNYKRM